MNDWNDKVMTEEEKNRKINHIHLCNCIHTLLNKFDEWDEKTIEFYIKGHIASWVIVNNLSPEDLTKAIKEAAGYLDNKTYKAFEEMLLSFVKSSVVLFNKVYKDKEETDEEEKTNSTEVEFVDLSEIDDEELKKDINNLIDKIIKQID